MARFRARVPVALPVRADTSVPRPEAIGSWRTYWRRVAVLARARWQPFVVFCVLTFAFNILRTQAALPFDAPMWVFAWRTHFEILSGLAPLVFAGLVLSEALGWRGIRHALASFVALLLAIVVSLAITLWFHGGVVNRPLVELKVIVSDAAFIGRTIWFNLAGGMLLVAYFAIREREAASARLAQAAQTERAQTERATMAARLKVMQARVEPELLFGALSDVRELYLRSPGEADALLDDLIAYLRAALPQMRGEASTLGREAALAVSYLKVVPAGRSGQLTAATSIPAEAQELAFPPMVLLPLVQAAAESAVSRVTISFDEAASTGVVLQVDPQLRPASWNDERLAPLRATLAHYFGAAAELRIDASRAVVRWAKLEPHHE